ncbi:hypothetical protein KBI52_12140 [Microvirga sp. HBU67558]|uniref:hypothetical protein n=1 Tax=Microvirga sp. HBU67558 TaxID=2824562 RepID=UPI001B35ABEE|nr:hypothetical protein [Microvirga sp. HBU67558]MBQ0820956.1 hypothetical protein [Microvirga sp. HBU67558]
MTDPRELKRGRGRPRGASRLNSADNQTLSKMADLIASTPMLPTTAMRRLDIHGEAETRRLQRKWRRSGQKHLEAAQERRRVAISSPRRTPAATMVGFYGMPDHMASAMARHFEYMNSPQMLSAFEQAQAFAESPAARQAWEIMETMETRRLQLEMMESPLAAHMRDMEARAAQLQAIADSAAVKALREKMENPAFQRQLDQMRKVAEQLSRNWPGFR